LTDPAPATTFAHLDGTVVLSRQIAELGIYPAVDPLDSTSRILDPPTSVKSTTPLPVRCSRCCRNTKNFRTLSPFWVWKSFPTKTRSPFQRARKIQRFLSQPFHVAEVFTGFPGKYVKIEDCVRAFKEICEGKHDDIPEQAFYMKGGIEEVVEAAKVFVWKSLHRKALSSTTRHRLLWRLVNWENSAYWPATPRL
jgi:F-type H+-transporting ATPase subunit beta